MSAELKRRPNLHRPLRARAGASPEVQISWRETSAIHLSESCSSIAKAVHTLIVWSELLALHLSLVWGVQVCDVAVKGVPSLTGISAEMAVRAGAPQTADLLTRCLACFCGPLSTSTQGAAQ